MLKAIQHIFSAPQPSDFHFTGESDDVISMHDAQGRFQHVTGDTEGLLDLTAQQLVGFSFADLVVPADRGKTLKMVSDVCQFARKSRIECRLFGADDELVWVDVTMSSDAEGRIRSIMRDVTHLRNRDREMSAAVQQANLVMENRTNHLADLSHEIRTPLSAMIGFADMMQCETFGPLGHEKYTEYAELIHKSGQHLLDLISEILDMSKIDAGRYDLHKKPINLSDIAKDCVEMTRLAAEQAGLRLSFTNNADLPMIYADPKVMRQILLNLLSNAVKFTRDGSIDVQIQADAENIWMAVIDTGIGMSQEQLSRVGQRYTQVHEQGVRGNGGTGLGLSLCSALAILHEGELRLVSEEGQGTKAVLQIPRIDAVAHQEDHNTTDIEALEAIKHVSEVATETSSDQKMAI